MSRRRHAFTLIELLVVISILMMLMTLLLPAANKIRGQMLAVQTANQVREVAKACDSYFQAFGEYPAATHNPPANGSGTSAKMSGSQSLWKALEGKSLYSPRSGELLPHQEISHRDTSLDGAYGNSPVLVDFRLSPPRPLLYYRARPAVTGVFPVEWDDNAVYCRSDEVKTQSGSTNEMATWLGATGKSMGFILISAGADRLFFTADDLCNFQR